MKSCGDQETVKVFQVVKVCRATSNTDIRIDLKATVSMIITIADIYPSLTDLAKPGSRGTNPMTNAITARQFVPYLLYVYKPSG